MTAGQKKVAFTCIWIHKAATQQSDYRTQNWADNLSSRTQDTESPMLTTSTGDPDDHIPLLFGI